jgi:hypothetical protein
VHDESQPKVFNQTVAHEFGHGFNQTPRPGTEPVGLQAHPQQYTNEHGGVGSHCRTGTTTVADTAYPAGLYRNGTCAMFHQVSPDTWTGEFCSDCQPYLRLTGMDKLG